MTRRQATAMVRRIWAAGGSAEIQEYCGRGMMPQFPGDQARTTIAVVMDRESAKHFGKKHAHDSMGLDVVVY